MTSKPAIRMSGLCCQHCGSDTHVVDSRATYDNRVRRRRECENPACMKRFTTYEQIGDRHKDAMKAMKIISDIETTLGEKQ